MQRNRRYTRVVGVLDAHLVEVQLLLDVAHRALVGLELPQQSVSLQICVYQELREAKYVWSTLGLSREHLPGL